MQESSKRIPRVIEEASSLVLHFLTSQETLNHCHRNSGRTTFIPNPYPFLSIRFSAHRASDKFWNCKLHNVAIHSSSRLTKKYGVALKPRTNQDMIKALCLFTIDNKLNKLTWSNIQ